MSGMRLVNPGCLQHPMRISNRATTSTFRRLNSGTSKSAPRTTVVRSTNTQGGSSQWLSPSWNWGYAVGDAHDAALKTRAKLGSPSARQDWLDRVMEGQVEVAEVEITLALKWQKVAREGRGGNPESWWNIMNDMAEGRFVGEQGLAVLSEELSARLSLLGLDITSTPASAAGKASTGCDDDCAIMFIRAVQVLEGLDFVQRGL